MRSVGIVQARLRSSRLPGKVLAPLDGTPLLLHLLERLCESAVDEWWVATSDQSEDDAIAEAVEGTAGGAVSVLRGDPEDVLERFLSIAHARPASWVLRATGDNPFVDAELVDRLLAFAESRDPAVDLVTQPGDALPLGYGVQIVRRRRLIESAATIPLGEFYHRVHVLSWLSAKGRVEAMPRPASWPARPRWRWTVDTAADLRAARAAFELFGGAPLSYPERVALLDAHPEVTQLNASVAQKRAEEG